VKRTLFLTAALLLVVQTAAAQVVTTEEPVVGAQPPMTPFEVGPTAQPPQPAAQPTLDAAAPVVQPTPVLVDSNVLPILVNARSDLEILANQQLGSERPAGWSGSLDVNNPQLAILIRLDLELLMASLVGLESIPQGWFGAVPSTPYAIARDIRHDLELLSDIVVGPSIRPPGWAGDDPLMRCDRSTQNLVNLLRKSYRFEPTVLPTNADYCTLLAVQAGQYVEANLLEGSAAAPALAQSTGGFGTENALADIGLAFLDRDATRRVGTIPVSESFTPMGRSQTQFSRMTLVRGAGFEVFVDYSTTTITEAEFLSLPDVNTLNIQPFCDAAWCVVSR
jgi:hypothetical protein